MTRDDTWLILQRHADAVNAHDIERLVALYAEDAEIASPMFEHVRGRAAVRRSFERLFAIYPDYHLTVSPSSFIWEGDRAAYFGTVRATQRIELLGLAPTGLPIEYHTSRVFALRDGHIIQEQRFYDFHGVLERLEKARIDQDLAVAASVQQMLVSRGAHRTDRCEVVASSLSCRTIGGDFLECVDLPSGALGIGVGDVSGKGPPAALVATMLQGMLSVIGATGARPAEVLARLNRGLCQRHVSPRFATVVYGVVALDGRFVYSNAGHNPLILLTNTGAIELTAGGTILGVFEGEAFPEEAVTVSAGDTLIAVSDGVTDAINPAGEPFGTARVLSCACAHRSATASELLTSLLDAVKTFVGEAPAQDDATIVVVRIH